MTYDVGDLVEVSAAFTKRPLTRSELATFIDAGTLPAEVGVDPESVVCTVRRPSEESEPGSITGSKGVYTAQIEADEAGTWYVAIDGTKSYVAAGEHSFKVARRKVIR